MSEMNTENRPVALRISGVKKMYKLGQIGGGSLQADLQSWWAKKRGKEDPNTIIGQKQRLVGQTFMALNGIDMTVYQGEAVGIIGSNGAGKSTLLKLISQITAPTAGKIELYGRVASMLEVGTGFNGEMTGRENVYMNGAILGMTKEEIDAKMEDIIEFSEVRDFIDTPVKRYSSGMYVKLAFSVAAHLDSEIMIMDEVLAVGDVAFQKKCLSKMRDVAKQEGRTVLYVSHNMSTIRQLCDRCVVLDKGKVVFNGDVEKAISVYLGTTSDRDFPVYYDFREKERNFHFGKEIFINSFKFVNKDNAQYKVGEFIEYEIEFDSKIALQDASVVLRISDKNNAANCASSISAGFEVYKGKNQIVRAKVETTALVEDVYCLCFEIISKAQSGTYWSYDNPGAIMPIQLVDDNQDIIWAKQYWGNVRLPDSILVKPYSQENCLNEKVCVCGRSEAKQHHAT